MKSKLTIEERRQRKRLRERIAYQTRRLTGVCTECSRPASESASTCSGCMIDAREYQHVRTGARRRYPAARSYSFE